MRKLQLSEFGKKMDLGGSESGSRDEISIRKHWQEDPNYQLALLDIDPPVLPERMTPGQAAQMSEVMEFLLMHMRRLIGEVAFSNQANNVEMSKQHWQQLLDIQSRLGEYLSKIGSPES